MGISETGQAFLLVIAAGLCTALGASVVFFPFLANLAKPNVLAISLAFAAGIMIYISLVDIYGKAIDGFAEDGFEDGDSFIYATLTFFLGCIIMLVLDMFVDCLLTFDAKRKGQEVPTDHDLLFGMGSPDAVNEMREKFEEKIRSDEKHDADRNIEIPDPADDDNSFENVDNSKKDNNTADVAVEEPITKSTTTAAATNEDDLLIKGEEGKQLTHMSWAMAASIAIHNFPEGMVTYLAYLSDNAVGAALAIGIGVHNIPEGLCVSMPLYYATGRRFYSFLWGTMSGLTEPLGALVVYLILKDGLTGLTNGILFGIVSGMMTVISIDELLPTAHKYAENPKHVTYTFLFGMLFIAASLMLFNA